MGGHWDAVFPETISYGAVGGGAYNTTLTRTDAGLHRNATQEEPDFLYDVALSDHDKDEIAALIAFFHARQGSAFAFRFKDWTLFSSATDGISQPSTTDMNARTLIGAGDNTTTVFDLSKTFSSGGTTRTIKITKPMKSSMTTLAYDPTAGDFVSVTPAVYVWVNGTLQAEGADFTVNYDDGRITFTTAPTTGHQIDASFLFHIPCVFDEDTDRGMMITVRDYLRHSARSVRLLSIPEERQGGEDYQWGGHTDHGQKAVDFALDLSDGRFQQFEITASGVDVTLPDVTLVAAGGRHLTLHSKAASTNTAAIKENAAQGGATVVAAFAADEIVELWLTENDEWVAR